MKNRILVILISISFNCFSQNPVLFENYWILEDLILDNVSHLPPNNDEVTNVILEFDSYEHNGTEYIDLSGYVCINAIGGLIDFNDIDNTFSFYDGPNQTLGPTCSVGENPIYEEMYFNFFHENYQNGNTFNYTITINNDDSKTLVITSYNGDQAIYGSQVLSVDDKETHGISLYYNSRTESIELDCKNQLKSISVMMYNSLGKKVLDFNGNNVKNTSIKLNDLSNDVYFVTLQYDNGQLIRKKIIKY
ncbi:T9SS type A sorting domain-containing protein [Winogradskyella sp.]|uniref:T9SS type A sorting domain-containing protein n=1 Tax=Winogradskyella sp. TaxID=1883156 RepID=UPI0026384874|nr:T9SS type A sorting domain-containing protein [Winogradskyella sp.]